MFELNLLVPSGESFLIELSFPQVHNLLQDIQSFVESKYPSLTFPPLPDLFCTQGDQLPVDTLPAQLSSKPPLPEASLPGVLPEPSLVLGKVSCPLCNRDISTGNWARHEREAHRDVIVCEGICLFTTKDPNTMAKHKESDDCLRYWFFLR